MSDELDDLIKRRRAAMTVKPDALDSVIAKRRAALEPTKRPGLLKRVGAGLANAAEQIVTHPIDTAVDVVTAPIRSAANAFLTPEVGEARPDPKLVAARFGSIPQQPAPAYDAEHGAQPVGGRTSAGLQTVANVAFPGLARGVTTRLATAGLPAIVARGAGMAAGGGMAGAAYSPDDPLAGGIAGAFLAPVLGEGIRGAGKVTSKALTAVGGRPSGRSAIEMALDAASMREAQGPQAGASASPLSEQAMTGRESVPASGQRIRAPYPSAREPLPPRAAPDVGPTPGQRVRAVFGSGVEASGVESAKTRGLRLIAERFDLDNVTPEDALAYAQQNAGKPIAALDLGEGNVIGLARLSKDTPGLGRRNIPKLLHERSSGSGPTEGATLNRVTQDFENRMGLAPEDYYATLEDMTGKMKAKAKVDYDKVRNTPVDDPEVLSLFDEPEFQTIHERIRSNARLGGKTKIEPLSTTEAIGGEKVRSLNPQTLGTLDKMKRQLDKIRTGKAESIGPIDKDMAYNMGQRIEAILTRMDELHPDYGKARANYGGSAEAIDAYNAGKAEFLKNDPRLTTQTLAKMPARLRDLYRRGGYDALRSDRLSKMDDGSNIGAFLEKNPDIRGKVAALAKLPEEGTALRGDLGVERHMGDRKNAIMGGPNTAERIIEHGETVPKLTAAASGGVRGMLAKAMESVVNKTAKEGTADVMGEVSKYLTRTGPEGIKTLFEEIAAMKASDAQAALRGSPRLSRVVGTGVGSEQTRRTRLRTRN